MRTLRIVLALATLLISASAAAASLELSRPPRWTVPLPAGLGDLEEQLRNAPFARIVVDGHSLVLRKPRVTSEGLAYESIDGFPNSTTRPNPVPWDDIGQVEIGTQSRPFAIVGGFVGLLAGLYVGMGGVEESPEAFLAACTAAGAGLGALFPIKHWKRVDPGPEGWERR